MIKNKPFIPDSFEEDTGPAITAGPFVCQPTVERGYWPVSFYLILPSTLSGKYSIKVHFIT